MLLQNKTALVTGSDGGIGKAILEAYAQQGANIFAHALCEHEDFVLFCQELEQKYEVEITPVYFDLTDSKAIASAVQTIFRSGKSLDILVNNAGVSVEPPRGFQMTKIDSMRKVMKINFFAQMELTQRVCRLMMRSGRGSIINMSSVAGLDEPMLGLVEYVSSKSAMAAASKRLAIELAPWNIRVNAIAPGLINTQMAHIVSDEFSQMIAQRTIMKRLGNPAEIADTAVFLGSELSSYITGQVLRVDGGMYE